MAAEVVRLWDGRHWPGRRRGGLLVFPFRGAPAGLATRRQLRAAGLRPGGQDITAVIEWRRGRAWAGLYRVDLARPVRPFTAAKRAAIDAALTTRRNCRVCGTDVGYYLPRSTGRRCWDCDQPAGDTPVTPDLAARTAKHVPAGPGRPITLTNTQEVSMSTDSASTEAAEAAEALVTYTADAVVLAYDLGAWRVLLVQRGWPPYQGQLALPGGHVDEGETSRRAAARELAEETGIIVDAAALHRVDVYDDVERDPRGRVVTVAYLAVLPAMVSATAGDDAASAGWLDVTEVLLGRHGLAFDHRQILFDALVLAEHQVGQQR